MEDKIRDIIKKEFSTKVLEIKRITEGYSHYMYEVKMEKNPYNIIIRFSNNSNKEFSLGKEKFVIELLSKNNVPSPKIYAFNDQDKNSYIIMEKIKGHRLDTIWPNLNDEEKYQITEEIGKLAAKIHSIKFEDFGNIMEEGLIEKENPFKFRQQGEKIKFSPYLRSQMKTFMRDFARLRSYKSLDSKFVADLFKYITINIEKMEYEEKPTLCHGDLIPGHIFVNKINDKYHITGVIDFEFAAAMSPEWDFIKMHRLGFFEDEKLKSALEKGYESKIKTESVEMSRLMRDVVFAWTLLEAGNKDLSDKKLEEVKEKINKSLNFNGQT